MFRDRNIMEKNSCCDANKKPEALEQTSQRQLDGLSTSLSSMPEEESLYVLADLFKVFSDSTRIKILYSLMDNDLCVVHIAQSINASQSAVSHQLRTLKQASLVKCRRNGKNVIYSLSDSHVHTILAQGLEHVVE